MSVKIILTNGNEHTIPDLTDVTGRVITELSKLNISSMVTAYLTENGVNIDAEDVEQIVSSALTTDDSELTDNVINIVERCFSTGSSNTFETTVIDIVNESVLYSSNETLQNALKDYLKYEVQADSTTKLIAINPNNGKFEGYDIDTAGDFTNEESIATIKSLNDLESALIGDLTCGRTSNKADVYIPNITILTDEALPATGTTGDYCIIKDTEAGTQTAYMYLDGIWQALNGNYTADKVYFNDNFKINKPFGKFIPDANTGSTNLPAEGKSIEALFKEAFASGNNPVVTLPAITLTSKVTASAEVGSTVGSFNILCEITGGNYSFGPADTGVYIPVYSTTTVPSDVDVTYDTISSGTHRGILIDLEGIEDAYFLELDDTERVDLPYTETINFKKDTFTPTYTDNKQTFKARAVAAHSAAEKAPNNDLEIPQETLQIDEGVISTSCSISIQGYRKPFWGVIAAANNLKLPTEYTSDEVRALSGKGTSKKGLPTSLEVPAGSQMVVFFAEAGAYSSLTATDDLANNSTVLFTKVAKAVYVKGANDYVVDVEENVNSDNNKNGKKYDLFYVNWNPGNSAGYTGIGSAKKLTLKWS